MKHKVLLLLAFSVFTVSATAQKFDVALFSMDRGLPSFFVKSIVQDSSGHIWIGTDNGVVRFDGYGLKQPHLKLLSPFVKQLRKANDGNIWVVNDEGLEKIVVNHASPLDIKLETFLVGTGYLTDSTLNFPRDVFEDRRNRLWISEPIAIVKIENGKLTRYPLDRKHHSMGYHLASRIHELDSGEIMVISEPGFLMRYEEASDALIEEIPTLPEPLFNAQASMVFQNDLYVGGETGVYRLNRKGKSGWEKLISMNGVMGILQYDDRLVVGTRHEGLYEFDFSAGRGTPAKRRVLGTETSGLKCLFTDREKNIWVASDQGAMLITPSFFGSLFFDNGFPYTQSLRLSPQGDILTSNERAVYKVIPSAGKFEKWSLKKLLVLNENTSILSVAGSENNFFAGLTDGRLLQVKNGVTKQVRLPDGSTESASKLFFINIDREGNLWILRDQEISITRLFPDGRIKVYGMDFGIRSRVLSIKQAPDKTLWVSAVGDTSFLYRYDRESDRFVNESRFSGVDKISNEETTMHDLAFLKSGEVFVVGSQGVLVYKQGAITRLPGFQVDNPNYLRSITADPEGALWIGAENGLYQYREGTQFTFGVNDGLPGSTCLYRRLVADSNGVVWVGTNTGLGYLSSTFEYAAPTRKPILELISSTQVGGVGPNGVIYENNTITFSAISLMIPGNRIRFQFYLDGFSSEWTSHTADREINFGLVPAGRYTLKIQAQKIGLGPSEILEVSILVQTYWYNSPLAYTLYSIAFAGLTAFVFMFFYNRRETQEIVSRLQGTEKRLAAVIASTPIFLFVIDRQLRVTRLAGHAVSSLPDEIAHMEGRFASEWFKSEGSQQEIRTALTGKESTFTYQSGAKIFEIKLTPMFNSRGETTNIVGVGTDITQRILMEEELIRAKNLAESASRSKSVFLASMSHELRTPLNAILGFSQILNNEADLPDKYRNFVSIMYKSGEHLLHMINDILDLSKIEAGHMHLNKKTFVFPEFIDDIQRMFVMKAHEKNLRFSAEKAADLPHVVLMDENKVRQILINLIGNAIKFTQHGEITVKVGHEDHQILIEVSDTGEGISESDKVAIFEPFVQGSRSFKEGTGLGLAITNRLVELMQGKITLTSTLGKGSTFRVSLPFEYGQLDEVIGIQQAGVRVTGILAPKPPVILVVDDILGNRALLTAFFAQVGIQCLEASNGREAVELCELHSPDLVLMDIVMPVMDGREALVEIRKRPMLADIPVLAVTASGLDSARQELLSLGFNEYIRKPFQQFELVAAIEKVTAWKFISDSSETDASEVVDPYVLRSEIDRLSPNLKEELLQCLELTDLKSAANIASKLPEGSQIKRLLEKAAHASNFRMLLLLDETLNS